MTCQRAGLPFAGCLLLALLLAACAAPPTPGVTNTPDATAIPPTATAVPPTPTATPEPDLTQADLWAAGFTTVVNRADAFVIRKGDVTLDLSLLATEGDPQIPPALNPLRLHATLLEQFEVLAPVRLRAQATLAAARYNYTIEEGALLESRSAMSYTVGALLFPVDGALIPAVFASADEAVRWAGDGALVLERLYLAQDVAGAPVWTVLARAEAPTWAWTEPATPITYSLTAEELEWYWSIALKTTLDALNAILPGARLSLEDADLLLHAGGDTLTLGQWRPEGSVWLLHTEDAAIHLDALHFEDGQLVGETETGKVVLWEATRLFDTEPVAWEEVYELFEIARYTEIISGTTASGVEMRFLIDYGQRDHNGRLFFPQQIQVTNLEYRVNGDTDNDIFAEMWRQRLVEVQNIANGIDGRGQYREETRPQPGDEFLMAVNIRDMLDRNERDFKLCPSRIVLSLRDPRIKHIVFLYRANRAYDTRNMTNRDYVYFPINGGRARFHSNGNANSNMCSGIGAYLAESSEGDLVLVVVGSSPRYEFPQSPINWEMFNMTGCLRSSLSDIVVVSWNEDYANYHCTALGNAVPPGLELAAWKPVWEQSPFSTWLDTMQFQLQWRVVTAPDEIVRYSTEDRRLERLALVENEDGASAWVVIAVARSSDWVWQEPD